MFGATIGAGLSVLGTGLQIFGLQFANGGVGTGVVGRVDRLFARLFMLKKGLGNG
jgi:hypothetical protein